MVGNGAMDVSGLSMVAMVARLLYLYRSNGSWVHDSVINIFLRDLVCRCTMLCVRVHGTTLLVRRHVVLLITTNKVGFLIGVHTVVCSLTMYLIRLAVVVRQVWHCLVGGSFVVSMMKLLEHLLRLVLFGVKWDSFSFLRVMVRLLYRSTLGRIIMVVWPRSTVVVTTYVVL